jgi:hypothetical protein
MIRGSRRANGWTLLDQLVLTAGAIPALVLSRFFVDPWRMRVFCISFFPFGVVLWCLVFLWLLPRIYHDKETSSSDHKDGASAD